MNKVIWTFVFTTIALALILVFVSVFRPAPSPAIPIDMPSADFVDSEFSTEDFESFASPEDSFFVNPVNTREETVAPKTPETTVINVGAFVGEGCQTTGCSGQICTNAGEQINSTCQWQEEYACYKDPGTQCIQNSQGQCGWVMSEELRVCLDTKTTSNTIVQ